MIYLIERVSNYGDKVIKPCKNAFQQNDEWCIKIDTLEDLSNLIEEVGCSLVINAHRIEIYDDYRE